MADVDHRAGIGVGEAAADDLGEEDAVVAGVDVAEGLAFQVADRVAEDRYAAGAVGDRQILEGGCARFKTFVKVAEKMLLARANHI